MASSAIPAHPVEIQLRVGLSINVEVYEPAPVNLAVVDSFSIFDADTPTAMVGDIEPTRYNRYSGPSAEYNCEVSHARK
jgi:hypothetical protein